MSNPVGARSKTSRWTDVLQSHLFWAFDATASSIPVFTPLFGFSGISGPKISVELETFKDGTYQYPRHVVKGGSVGAITFNRAATIYDSDFYDWIYYAINGTTASKANIGGIISNILGEATGPVRRNILIIHFMRINLNQGGLTGSATTYADIDSTNPPAGNNLGAAAFDALIGGIIGGIGGAVAGAAIGGVFGGFGATQFATWFPGRAWMLHNTIPTDYSINDLDANNANASVMSLTLQPEWVEQFDASG